MSNQINFIGWLTALDNSNPTNANCSAKQFLNLFILHLEFDNIIRRVINSSNILSNQWVREVSPDYAIGPQGI
jgi:hypothetical protein